jgi:hypothetical protein
MRCLPILVASKHVISWISWWVMCIYWLDCEELEPKGLGEFRTDTSAIYSHWDLPHSWFKAAFQGLN